MEKKEEKEKKEKRTVKLTDLRVRKDPKGGGTSGIVITKPTDSTSPK